MLPDESLQNPTVELQSTPEHVEEQIFEDKEKQSTAEANVAKDETADTAPERKPTKRKMKQTSIFEFQGQIKGFEKEIDKALEKIRNAETEDYLKEVKSSLQRLSELEADLKHQTKKMKIVKSQYQSQMETLDMLMKDRKEKEVTIKRQEMEIDELRLGGTQTVPNSELLKIPEDKRNIASKVVQNHECIKAENCKFRCNICTEGWRKVIDFHKEPQTTFAIHTNSVQAMEAHVKSETHIKCYDAYQKYTEDGERMKKLLEKERLRIDEITCNIIKLVYFLLVHNISANMFEEIINLLECLNALTGNQLHSRKTAAAIAACIDEVFMQTLVAYLISDSVKSMTLEADELSDRGGLKSMLVKLMFFQNDDLQRFVFLIFESLGDSEEAAKKFFEEVVKTFQMGNDLTEEDVIGILDEKLVSGSTDRASKMMKFMKLLMEKLRKFIHITCDNHIMETAWERTQDEFEWLEETEDQVKDEFGLTKNSAKRIRRLQDIAETLEKKFKKLQTIFKIRFITSEANSLEASANDQDELIILTGELSNDTKLKPGKRSDMKELNKRVRNLEIFCNKLAILEALKSYLCPYQLWGQGQKVSAIERAFEMARLETKIRAASKNMVSEDTAKQLEKVDFESKKWKGSGTRVIKFMKRKDCIKLIAKRRNLILNSTLKNKKEIHEEVDHPGMKEISHAFDTRLWKLDITAEDKEEEIERKVARFLELMQLKFKDENDDINDFCIGEDISTLFESFSAAVHLVVSKKMLPKIQKINCIRAQWKIVLDHPIMHHHIRVISFLNFQH